MRIPRLRRAPRVLVGLLALPLLLPLATAPADAASPPVPAVAADPGRTATVMTRNLYLGASLDDIIAALTSGDLGQVVAAATATWTTVQASHPAERMGAVADEIVAADPAAVGLQEVSTWTTLPLDPRTLQPAGAPTVRYDFLQLLLDALTARGVSYHAVDGATSTNFTSAFIPVLVGGAPSQAVKLVDRDVILVRDGITATNAHHGNFQTVLQPPAAPLKVDRGWGSADLSTRQATFRLVNAHTEAWGPEQIRVGEVLELFAAQDQIAAQTGALPTVYVGDYNSAAGATPATSEDGYNTLRSRLSDLGGVQPTCCQEGTLTDPTPDFTTRIDLVLGTAGVSGKSSYRTGVTPVDLPGSTWWASDHAGVVSSLVIG
jgi:endonuclease/exonuclease/phosphatase family metal-dependent hydrolase